MEVVVNSVDYGKAILESTVEGIISLDPDGLITTANGSAVRMFAYDHASQMIGLNVRELTLHPCSQCCPFLDQPCPNCQTSQQNQNIFRQAISLRRADGSIFYRDCRSVPLLLDAQVVGTVVTFHDNQQETERARLRSIFVNAPVAMAMLEGPEYRFSFTNNVFREYFPSKDYLGKTVEEFISGADDRDFIPLLDKVYKSGERIVGKEKAFAMPTKRGQGKTCYFDFDLEPLRGPDAKVEGIFAVLIDVSDQVLTRQIEADARHQIEIHAKKLFMEKAKLQVLVSESTSAIALMRGPDLVFEVVNKKWTELVSDREYINRKFVDVYPELVGTPVHKSLRDIYETGTPFVGREIEWKARNSSGEMEDQYFDCTNIRILDADGGPYGVYCNSHNVTHEVRARLDLERANLKAEQANQIKSAFLANMSHEIRTPLGVILGFTDLLREPNLKTKERDQFLATISRHGKALIQIIDDILDLAKVESGKLQVEKLEFSLVDLIDDILDLFREVTRTKKIYLRAEVPSEIPSRIVSDPTRLRQIMINIVGNAVKFTQSGGVTIQVKGDFSAPGKAVIQIAVTDTGVGLSAGEREKLFQPFVQVDNSTSRKFGGTGLGLAISMRLAHALGGDITIEKSAPGQGSTFIVKLLVDLARPRISESALHVPDVIEADRPLKGSSLLVVDDSEDCLFLTVRMLENLGASVDSASHGVEALRMALKENYDLILMDMQMPQMDGYEATRLLREAGFKNPILALTAHAMVEQQALTYSAGCDGHLTKPLVVPKLREMVLKFLGRKEGRQRGSGNYFFQA